jgi:CheY-like chemotaxis protein
VIGNLLHNAAKFTNRGGKIWLTLEQEGDQAVVRVRDTGIGVAGNELARIFELFVQVDASLGGTRGGLGLGLPLARKLVELHEGSIAAYSKGLTHGTELVLRLPLLTNLQPGLPQEPGKADTAPAARRRVLVVDDNKDSADSLATLLALMGHEVDTANDGVGAVSKAAGFHPDLILLDIGMPRLNGYEAARWIREQGHKNLTLVALTGWGQAEDRRLSEEAGFDAHIVKPIELDTLTKLLAGSGQPLSSMPAGSGMDALSGA